MLLLPFRRGPFHLLVGLLSRIRLRNIILSDDSSGANAAAALPPASSAAAAAAAAALMPLSSAPGLVHLLLRVFLVLPKERELNSDKRQRRLWRGRFYSGRPAEAVTRKYVAPQISSIKRICGLCRNGSASVLFRIWMSSNGCKARLACSRPSIRSVVPSTWGLHSSDIARRARGKATGDFWSLQHGVSIPAGSKCVESCQQDP